MPLVTKLRQGVLYKYKYSRPLSERAFSSAREQDGGTMNGIRDDDDFLWKGRQLTDKRHSRLASLRAPWLAFPAAHTHVTNVPLKLGRFPAKMYLLDINPDRLISGEKQSVGVNFNLKKGFGFPKPLLFAFQTVS